MTRSAPWGPGLINTIGETIPSALEYVEEAGLRWRAELADVQTTDDGVAVPNWRAVIRSDTRQPLGGMVGNRYTLVQNMSFCGHVDDLVDVTEGKLKALGSRDNGQRTYAVIELNQELTPDAFPGDVTESYLLSTNRHDGLGSLRDRIVAVRWRCTNGLVGIDPALAGFDWKIRHLSSAQERMRETIDLVAQATDYLGRSKAFIDQLAETRYTATQFEDLIRSLDPIEPDMTDHMVTRIRNRREVLREIYESDTIAPIRETAWGALNAINEWELWKSQTRGYGSGDRAGWQLDKLLDGWNQPTTRRALRLLVGGGTSR